eukprot:CAMPEP_0203923682 /NCGR_PEP_ID=MMETSP0359-20131031/63535_1 /ASSEMBLY_ACC=CAM_ASM_000338 /TAXON_ID=268821 /ORGANISM="Scrippsiella Hangoei, Strain SHTV-5" /LENGTH=302 /DNA_ID=CAMNT_0050851789 /DNA_START=9 /DNA_END=917 /DNA_ORIENTATION=+
MSNGALLPALSAVTRGSCLGQAHQPASARARGTPASPPGPEPASAQGRLRRRKSLDKREDDFAVWRPSAADRTPNSVYRPRGSGPPAHPDGPHGWNCTLRTALDSSHARVRTEQPPDKLWPLQGQLSKAEFAARVRAAAMLSGEPDERCGILDGDWASKVNNEMVGTAERGYFYWEEDDHRTRLAMHGERRDTVTMSVDGVVHCASLSEDGRLLRWNDGDTWFRVLPESVVDQSVRDVSYSALDLEECLPWVGWTARERPGTFSGPTSKSIAAADWVSFTQSVRSDPDYADALILKPSAVFM